MFKMWMVLLILKQSASSLGYNPYNENFYYNWQDVPGLNPYNPVYQLSYQNNFTPASPFSTARNTIPTDIAYRNYQSPQQSTFQQNGRLQFQQSAQGNRLANFPSTNVGRLRTQGASKQNEKLQLPQHVQGNPLSSFPYTNVGKLKTQGIPKQSEKLQLPQNIQGNPLASFPTPKVDAVEPQLASQQNETLQSPPSSEGNSVPSLTSVSITQTRAIETDESLESISPEKIISNDEVPLSEAKCQGYYPEPIESILARKGIKFIISGEPTLPGEFTFMAALGWETITADYDYKCGGSLISELFVLTAAHCTSLYGRPPAVAKLGGVKLDSKTDGEVARVAKIIVHPNYSEEGEYNDIALIQLEKNASLNVVPACLWRESSIDEKEVKAIGYGHTVFAGPKSNELLKVNLTLSTNEECGRFFPPAPRIRSSIVGTQLCAGDPRHERDTCQGDSGGPLLIHKDLRSKKVPYIIGITSVGLQCAGIAPSVYTRISEYIDWIESVVWP